MEHASIVLLLYLFDLVDGLQDEGFHYLVDLVMVEVDDFS